MVTLIDWRVIPEENTLTSLTTGKEVKLSARTMDVLVYLIKSHGKVVTSEELLNRFWPNSVSSDHAIHNVIADLRSALGDSASNPKYIRTYTKRGYALVAKPQETGSAVELVNRQDTKQSLSLFGTRKTVAAGSVALAVIIMAAVGITLGLRNENPDTIYVAPLDLVNVDPEHEFWAEQLPASLVLHLSKIPSINVISGVRDYVSEYPVQQEDLDSLDYILGGHILQEDDRIRLQIDLVNAGDKSTVFSEQFDINSDDVFDVHDDVGNNVTSALSIYLDDEQRDEMNTWGTANPVAYSMFLKAGFHARQSNHEDIEIAIESYIDATKEDENFLNAYLGLARTVSALSIYSHDSKNTELRELVNDALRETLRIAPENTSAVAVLRDIALRLEGDNRHIIEETLRSSILQGNTDDFALSRYAALLTEARLYFEAEQYYSLTGDRLDFPYTPESSTYSLTLIEPPENLVQAQIENLVERPKHIPILNALIRGYIFSGNSQQATYYLQRQMEIDNEGAFSMLNQVIISSLWGSSFEAGDEFEDSHQSNPSFNLSHGARSFIMGDVQSGVTYWSSLSASDLRRLSLLLYKIEMFFPALVLSDPRYLALLEDLDMGLSWQRRLMEGVQEMSSVTGVGLHPDSLSSYESNEFLMNNNAWDHASIDYPNRNPKRSEEREGA
ncbi:MAG: winged helix-turn-helix domain-containing protein [Pseudomonadales bacterium]|nr:winged helix-turn-helix domain-containing protein [Pseudomonadales bacterium]